MPTHAKARETCFLHISQAVPAEVFKAVLTNGCVFSTRKEVLAAAARPTASVIHIVEQVASILDVVECKQTLSESPYGTCTFTINSQNKGYGDTVVYERS
jgi:hypothetical protein